MFPGRQRRTRAGDARRGFSSTEILHRIISNLPEPREVFSRTLTHCISTNPRSARWIIALMALYLHLGPFSRYLVQQIDEKIQELDTDARDPRRTAEPPRAIPA